LRWLVWFSILAAMRRALPLFALFALLACDRNPHAGPQPVANDPAFAGQKDDGAGAGARCCRPGRGGVRAGVAGAAGGRGDRDDRRDAADLRDLGEGRRGPRRDALRTYCRRWRRGAQDALNNAIDKQLIERAAEGAGSPSIEAYMQAKVEAAGGEPSEEELLAFYNKHASPEAPALRGGAPAGGRGDGGERTRGTIDALVAEGA
jgi:hypothetical protein